MFVSNAGHTSMSHNAAQYFAQRHTCYFFNSRAALTPLDQWVSTALKGAPLTGPLNNFHDRKLWSWHMYGIDLWGYPTFTLETMFWKFWNLNLNPSIMTWPCEHDEVLCMAVRILGKAFQRHDIVLLMAEKGVKIFQSQNFPQSLHFSKTKSISKSHHINTVSLW